MDTKQRIETLERELSRLRQLIPHEGTEPIDVFPNQPDSDPDHGFFDGIHRIGAGLMAVLAVGSYLLVFPHVGMGDAARQITGFAVGLVLIALGAILARPGKPWMQALLACGLGIFMGAAFRWSFQGASAFAGVLIAVLIVAMVLLVRWKRSEAIFTVPTLAVCILSTPLAAIQGSADAGLFNTAVQGLALAGGVVVLAGPRAGILPLWAACAAVYLNIGTVLLETGSSGGISWAGIGVAAFCQTLIALAVLTHVRRGGLKMGSAVLLVLVNAMTLAVLVWLYAEKHSPAAQGGLLAVSAFSVALPTVWSYLDNRHGRAVTGALGLSTLCIIVWMLWVWVPRDLFAPLLALASVFLVVVYRQTGSRFVFWIQIVLVLLAFVIGLFSLQSGQILTVGLFALGRNWLAASGLVIMLCVCAALYEKTFPCVACPVSGHAKAMLHAALAAMVLLTATALQRGTDANLPFILAMESLGMAGLGMILFTPQIAVAGMFLLAPAHLCYHAFLWESVPGFAEQVFFARKTVALVALTLFAAGWWERYLRRFHVSTMEWDHYLVAMLPSAAAGFMAFVLLQYSFLTSALPAETAAIGLFLLLMGRVFGLEGMTMSAVVLLIWALVVFMAGVPPALAGAEIDNLFFVDAVLLSGLFVAAEWLTSGLYSAGSRFSRSLSGAARTLFCLMASITALAGVYAWSFGPELGRNILCVAAVFGLVGGQRGRHGYYWLGFFLSLAVLVLVSFAGMRGMRPGAELVVAFAGMAALVAGEIRAYLRRGKA